MNYLDAQKLMERFRAIRDRKGITAAKLGELSGVHRVKIGKLESGHADLRFNEAIALAKALDVDLRVLITDEPLKVTSEVIVI